MNVLSPATVGSHLFRRLREAGVDVTFGVPGDFVLPLYAAQERFSMRTVVCTHEPGAAFAADAYARLRGLGVALATYGAGALNMVNAVAMAYAEHTPLLVVSGAPDTGRRGPDVYLHHRVKSFESQVRIFREVTVAAEVIESAEDAAAKIDAVVAAVKARRRPGYLEIPRDLVSAALPNPVAQSVSAVAEAAEAATDPGALQEAVDEIAAHLAAAKRPALYAGIGVRRYGLTQAAVRLAEAWGLPVATSVMGKASFPESHPQFVGVYMGALGDPLARAELEQSDCVLALGVIKSDVNTGFWTADLDEDRVIGFGERSVRVRHHRFDGVPIGAVVQALAARQPPSIRAFVAPKAELPPAPAGYAPLTTQQIIGGLRRLEQSAYHFVADVGDAWFVGLELRADIFLAPGYYATMGYAVPGALGAGLADGNRRPFVLVGDGAFQMTGVELATLVDAKLSPIVLLLNNASYMMLEALDEPHAYYKRRPWDYVAIAKAVGVPGERAATGAAFATALKRAVDAKGPYFIEAIVDSSDRSPVMTRLREHLKARRAPAALAAK